MHASPTATALVAALALLALGACHEPPTSGPHPLKVRAADKSLAQVPDAPLSGKLRAQRFSLADARVRIEARPGRERLDVFLSEAPIERCGLPLARTDRRVWLRFDGTPTLDGSPLRVEAGERGAFEPHYEVRIGKQWLGHGGGAALLSLKDAGFGKYVGKLWACFDDGLDSCVEGRFEAGLCRSELDVDDSVWGAGHLESRQAARPAP